MTYLIKLEHDNRKYPPGQRHKPDKYIVGTYEPFSSESHYQGTHSVATSYSFVSLFAFKTARSAVMIVNYLNGGNEPTGGLKDFLEKYIAIE